MTEQEMQKKKGSLGYGDEENAASEMVQMLHAFRFLAEEHEKLKARVLLLTTRVDELDPAPKNTSYELDPAPKNTSEPTVAATTFTETRYAGQSSDSLFRPRTADTSSSWSRVSSAEGKSIAVYNEEGAAVSMQVLKREVQIVKEFTVNECLKCTNKIKQHDIRREETKTAIFDRLEQLSTSLHLPVGNERHIQSHGTLTTPGAGDGGKVQETSQRLNERLFGEKLEGLESTVKDLGIQNADMSKSIKSLQVTVMWKEIKDQIIDLLKDQIASIVSGSVSEYLDGIPLRIDQLWLEVRQKASRQELERLERSVCIGWAPRSPAVR